MDNSNALIDEMIAYYRARASEYDQWFLRQGRYDRGERFRQSWFREVAAVERALLALGPHGDILELACGTGIWTRQLAAIATSLTAVDASPEVITLNRQQVDSSHVEYIVADLYKWRPAITYDFVFFGFWLSHVPPERFEAFWELVAQALKPNGRAFFVDSLFNRETSAKDQSEINRSGRVERRLNDGRTFEIVKIFYEPEQLEERLSSLGWQGYVRTTGKFFLYGCVSHEVEARDGFTGELGA